MAIIMNYQLFYREDGLIRKINLQAVCEEMARKYFNLLRPDCEIVFVTNDELPMPISSVQALLETSEGDLPYSDELMNEIYEKIHDKLMDGTTEGEVEVCGESGTLTVEWCGEINDYTDPRPGIGRPESMRDYDFQIISKQLHTENQTIEL